MTIVYRIVSIIGFICFRYYVMMNNLEESYYFVSFAYHMYGESKNIGDLEVVHMHSSFDETLWKTGGTRDNAWKTAKVCINYKRGDFVSIFPHLNKSSSYDIYIGGCLRSILILAQKSKFYHFYLLMNR